MSDDHLPAHTSERKSFYRETITYGTFVNQHFKGTDFRRVEARLTSFESCIFIDCDFTNANFTYARFINCRFEFSDDQEIADASFGGAFFDNSDLRTQGRLRFKHCGLRDAHFFRSKIGTVDFTSNGLEDAYFESCQIEDIDIRSVAATALMFKDCRFGRVQVSVENFVAIIGSSSFITESEVCLLSRLSLSTHSAVATQDEMISLIESYEKEIELDTFQNLNVVVQLCTVKRQSIDIEFLNGILGTLSAANPLLAFDQVSNIVKLLDQYGLHTKLDLHPIRKLFRNFHSHISKLPHSLVMRVRAAQHQLFSMSDTQLEIRFVFQSVDAKDEHQRQQCYEFFHEFRAFVGVQPSEHSSITEGSLKLSEYIKLIQARPWLVALVIIASNSTISVSIDVNQLPADIISAAKEVVEAYDERKLSQLRLKAQELDLRIEIERKSNEYDQMITANELTKELLPISNLCGDSNIHPEPQAPLSDQI